MSRGCGARMSGDTQRQPIEESPKAAQAWADYVALGADRSLPKLIGRYRTASETSPTTRLATLKQWSAEYHWQSRLLTLAAEQGAMAEARERQRIDEIMSSGFAVVHNRVKALDTLAEAVFAELAKAGDDEEPAGFYRKEVKVAANGTAFDQQVFDKAKFDTLRGLLDDLAKEKGDRRAGMDVKHTIDRRREAEAIAAEIGKADDPAIVGQIERDLLLGQEPVRR